MNEFNNYYIICHFIGREINYVYVFFMFMLESFNWISVHAIINRLGTFLGLRHLMPVAVAVIELVSQQKKIYFEKWQRIFFVLI